MTTENSIAGTDQATTSNALTTSHELRLVRRIRDNQDKALVIARDLAREHLASVAVIVRRELPDAQYLSVAINDDGNACIAPVNADGETPEQFWDNDTLISDLDMWGEDIHMDEPDTVDTFAVDLVAPLGSWPAGAALRYRRASDGSEMLDEMLVHIDDLMNKAAKVPFRSLHDN